MKLLPVDIGAHQHIRTYFTENSISIISLTEQVKGQLSKTHYLHKVVNYVVSGAPEELVMSCRHCPYL